LASADRKTAKALLVASAKRESRRAAAHRLTRRVRWLQNGHRGGLVVFRSVEAEHRPRYPRTALAGLPQLAHAVARILKEQAVMRLFFAPGSSSLLPHIVLHESGLPFAAIRINEHTKEITGGGDFREVNPLGYVPALALDDGTLLTEGPAIVQYISDVAPEKRLAPPNGTLERTKLQAWLNFMSSEMHKGGFSPLFYKGVSEQSREVFRRRLEARFTHLDRHLDANEYLLGSHFSVADVHLFVVSNWASWVEFDLSPYQHVGSFRDRIAARSAVQRAMRAEGLVPWPRTQP
jgi:glutathione S-transferase